MHYFWTEMIMSWLLSNYHRKLDGPLLFLVCQKQAYKHLEPQLYSYNIFDHGLF